MSRSTWDAHHANRSAETFDGNVKFEMSSGGHFHFGLTDEIKASA
jgi:hypothetical protein